MAKIEHIVFLSLVLDLFGASVHELTHRVNTDAQNYCLQTNQLSPFHCPSFLGSLNGTPRHAFCSTILRAQQSDLSVRMIRGSLQTLRGFYHER